MLSCPECNSTKLIKFGRKFTRDRQTDKRHLAQQYQCKSCGRITIKPTYKEDIIDEGEG